MSLILTAAAMREADRFTIEDFGIPGFTLMESAGRAAAEWIDRLYGPVPGTIAVYCGKGNNGGDGFVVARQLYARGGHVRVVTLGAEEDLSEDAAQNLQLLRRLAENDAENRLEILPFESVDAVPPAHLHIDALLGTGLTHDLRDPVRSVVGWINARPEPTVALDVPTGLHSDLGTILGDAVDADLTVTMGALKAGLVIGDGPRLAGRVEIAEIGIPRFVLEKACRAAGCAVLTTDSAVRSWLPSRGQSAHKYSVGLALVVAGAPGMSGAPVMAATAAARSGAGFVVCACPRDVHPIVAGKLTEVTTIALPSSERGIEPEAALDVVEERLAKSRALLVGCGMGRLPDTQRFIRLLLGSSNLPTVIDADGLVALEGHMDLVRKHSNGRWILTPHAGEFRRIAGADADVADPIGTAARFAERWNVVLVLKGLPTVVGLPDGRAYVSGTGNPALATAGTGDVLSGLCVGLLAQGLSLEHAAAAAVHLGGAAADRYAGRLDARSMVAMDLVDEVPRVLRERLS